MKYDDEFLKFLWDNLQPRDRMKALNNSPKTVWIIGAGASHHYGMNERGVKVPLANGFFDAFHSLPISEGFRADVGPLINYVFYSRGIKPAEISTLRENIEDFMTSIEQELENLREKKNSGAELSEDEVKKGMNAAAAFNNMAFIFANVINESQNGPSCTAYHELLKFCSPQDTFITFNWDTLLDRALADSGCWSPNNGYGISFDLILDGSWKIEMDMSNVSSTNIKLLKLHGSTNWLTANINIHPFDLEYTSLVPDEGKVFLYWHTSLPYETYRGRWCGGYVETCYGYYPPSIPFTAFTKESLAAPPGHMIIKMAPAAIYSPFKEPRDNALPSSPLLITPVRQKQYNNYADVIDSLWQQSGDELSSAERVVIIGYSFPVTDIRPMEMLRSTLASRRGEIAIEIIDPYANDIAERIGKKHLENAKSVTIHNIIFEEYLELLWNSAPQIVMNSFNDYPEIKQWVQKVHMMLEASPYIHGDN